MQDTIVALSGGVDSGVSAALLLDEGVRVRALFMRHRFQKTFDKEGTREILANIEEPKLLKVYLLDGNNRLVQYDWTPDNFPFLLPVDFASAIEVASFLKIELILLDVDNSFKFIVDNFVKEYYDAHTPNPCVLCNRRIKFGLLWHVAQQLKANTLATGHYVKIKRTREWCDRQTRENQEVDSFFNYQGLKDYEVTPDWLAQDKEKVFFARSLSEKEQTYFLYNVSADVLPHIVFPVGGYTKDVVRAIAARKGLPVAVRKDSQEICFVPNRQHVEFIHNYCADNCEQSFKYPSDTSGNFLSLDGKVIGKHSGYEKYTIGQRKGLGMGFGERIFVQSIDSETHGVTLGPYESLGVDRVRAVETNWLVEPPIEQEFRCEVKVRYRNESSFATVKVNKDGTMEAKLDQTRYGVAPGQALVCYWRDRLLGGGKIVL